MNRQRRDELYSWLQNLTDEQIWKLWLTYDRAFNCKGCSPYTGNPITTHDEAVNLIGDMILAPDAAGPERMEDFERELQFDEEFQLATWMRKLRYSRETAEEEQERYEGYDKLAEELARKRRQRRPGSYDALPFQEIKLDITLLPPGDNPGSAITSDMDCWKAVYQGDLISSPALRGFGESPADALKELIERLCARIGQQSYP